MMLSSCEGGAYVDTFQAIAWLDIAPGSGTEFVDSTDANSPSHIHVLHTHSSPRFRVGYRDHVTEMGYPSGRGFYARWKVFLFFGRNHTIVYSTITDGDFPELSARQLLMLKWAVKSGYVLPQHFQYATTTECERLLFDLYTWKRLR